MSLFLVILVIINTLLVIIYKRWSKLYDRWKEKGIIHRNPYPFVGNFIENLLKKKTIGEVLREIAEEFSSHKYIGVYTYITPDLMITDPEDAYTVMVKEFSHFIDRLPEVKYRRPIDQHLMFLTGAKWKGVRSKVSPVFSSGKLKAMLPLMIQSYDNTSKYIETLQNYNDVLDLKNILDMYIISVSASTIYGMDPIRLADPNSEFKRTLDSLSEINFKRFVLLTLNIFFPRILYALDISPIGNEGEKYFIDLVLNTFKERVESGQVRDDVIQQLLQLKQNGKIEVSQWVKEDEEELGSEQTSVTESFEITDEMLVAQGFVFLMAGMDPLKSTMAMLLVELASCKKAMKRVREDIQLCIDRHNGLTWQALKDMQYLDWCLSETMRLHPPAEFNMRYCVKDFTFPNGPTVEKGTRVIIPMLKINRDPIVFPEPDQFIPERFERPLEPWVYFPFGMGPRMCIARRFALQEMKLFAVKLLQDYDVTLDSRTDLPVRTDKWFFLRRNISDIYIKLNKRIKLD